MDLLGFQGQTCLGLQMATVPAVATRGLAVPAVAGPPTRDRRGALQDQIRVDLYLLFALAGL
jgi:hypothetical protein